MEPLTLSTFLPSAFGFIGGLAQKWVAIKEKRVDHELALARMEAETKRDERLADLKLRQTTEEQAGASFNRAVDAQATITTGTPWVQDVLALFRPGITCLLFLFSFGLFFFVDEETKRFLATGFFNLGQTAGGYWFGQRSFEKLQTITFAKKAR